MPANTSPIFSINGESQWTTLMTASNPIHVSGNTSYLVFTAGTNGSYVQKIRFRHFAIVASTNNTNATVARVWINNGSDVTVAANSTLFDEITIAAMTYSATAAQVNYELPLNFALPPSYRLYVTLGTAPSSTNAAIQATVIGGDY
jgi:hypothetical protein